MILPASLHTHRNCAQHPVTSFTWSIDYRRQLMEQTYADICQPLRIAQTAPSLNVTVGQPAAVTPMGQHRVAPPREDVTMLTSVTAWSRIRVDLRALSSSQADTPACTKQQGIRRESRRRSQDGNLTHKALTHKALRRKSRVRGNEHDMITIPNTQGPEA